MTSSGQDGWPDLTLSRWEATRDTLHMWTQIVGKVRLTLEPMVNHWWQVPLYVSARGLTTSMMHAGGQGLEIEFDFIDHVLELRRSDGGRRRIALEPRSVADFYRATMQAVADLGVQVTINTRPVEVVEAIRFEADTQHDSYDPGAAHRYWLALMHADRLMRSFRGRFLGKSSPVHYFWGGSDVALTRFSGRTAPEHPGGVPNTPDWVQRLAYSHEVHSCGFWPGGSAEGSFYGYAYPQPEGFADWSVRPDAAFYDKNLREFILPYRSVRTSADPDGMVMAFFQSTYEAAAELAEWDRSALEVAPPVNRKDQ